MGVVSRRSRPSDPEALPASARPATVAVDAFRRMMSAFPTGVAVVTTTDENGRPRGLTCTSLSSITLSPPTLMVSLLSTSGTLRAARGRGGFAVNLLHSRGRRAAEVFSSPVPDRFAEVGWRPVGDSGLPWLARDAFAVAECRVAGSVEVGDHTLVLGEVVRVLQTADVPLLYGLRSFSSWLSGSAPPPPSDALGPDHRG